MNDRESPRRRTPALAREIDAARDPAREPGELEARLGAEVSHRLRTQLTLTLGPLKDLEAGDHGPLPPGAARQLALARRNAERALALVEELRDTARVESDRPEARVRWPAEAGPPPKVLDPAADGGPRQAEPAPLEALLDDRTTVLVVDDYPDVRLFVRGHLENRYRVLEAGDGAEGYRLARESLPDLVLTDLVMPVMDGLELTRRLKADPELDFVPVVLLTARDSLESRLEGLGGGADDYLTKPIEMSELQARIDNLIRQRRRLRERLAAAAIRPPALLGELRDGLSAGERAFLERVRQAIEEGLGDEGFNVEILADGLAIDRSQLFRRLKEITGRAPSELILETRLAHAAQLLAHGEGGVGEVAVAVGFRSVAHFSERFRRRFEATPSTWRRGRTGDPQPSR